MIFADEPADYPDRRFECGWSARQQTAASIADSVQLLAKRLGAIDLEYGRVRPDPGTRRFRPGDLGPILEMASAELTELIERRGRFDPPRRPAPVSPTGYDVLYRNDLKGLDPSFLSISVRAGGYGSGAENRVRVWPERDHPLWREVERGVEVLDAMVECWDPEWACAYRFVPGQELPRVRPWLAWMAKPLQPRPSPPYRRPYPYPFPLDYAGPPAEVRAWHGGELQIWP